MLISSMRFFSAKYARLSLRCTQELQQQRIVHQHQDIGMCRVLDPLLLAKETQQCQHLVHVPRENGCLISGVCA